MSYILDKHIVYVNSASRLEGTDSNFSYLIDLSGTSRNFDRVVCLSAIIHKSYYLVESGNSFTLIEGALTASISITAGNYNRRTFAAAIQTALNAASPNGWTYVVSSPAANAVDTGKYTLTVTGNGGVQPSFVFTDTLYQQLGFNENSTNAFVADSLVSTNAINLNLEDSIFVHSDICQNNGDNVLQEILTSNTTTFGSVIFQNPAPEAYSKQMSTNANNVYRFYLTSEDGTTINLNGQNIVLTLMLYKENDVYKMLKDFLKYTVMKDSTV